MQLRCCIIRTGIWKSKFHTEWLSSELCGVIVRMWRKANPKQLRRINKMDANFAIHNRDFVIMQSNKRQNIRPPGLWGFFQKKTGYAHRQIASDTGYANKKKQANIYVPRVHTHSFESQKATFLFWTQDVSSVSPPINTVVGWGMEEFLLHPRMLFMSRVCCWGVGRGLFWCMWECLSSFQ